MASLGLRTKLELSEVFIEPQLQQQTSFMFNTVVGLIKKKY